MTLKFFEKLSQDFTQLLESEYDYNVVIEVGKQSNIQLLKHIQGLVSLENLEVSDIFDFLVAANELKLIELSESLQTHLINNNSSWLRLNFSRVYQISFQNENFKDLKKFCNDIIAKHPSMVFDSDNFTTFQENALIALLKNDDLQMEESEANTLNLPPDIKDWTNENFKSLKVTLKHFLPHIRYFQITGKDVLNKIKPYRNILEENLCDDIMSRFADPDVFITFPILPPRKKVIVQLPPRSVITLSSSIITLQHAAEISSWIDRRSKIYDTTEIPYEFKLLLRGSRDGFKSEVFHKLCDNIPGTVVVVKFNSTNEILGGYNPLIWKVDGEYATTADSFIFSLKNGNLNESILSRVTNISRAISYYSISEGPWFSSFDFGMGTGSNLKKWHCSKYVYDKPIRTSNGWFSINDYEAFQVCKNI
ncbi:hypothetical protein C2G38_2159409 [Gigaspora rosea]|uniref:TLDc domain-containing protein n=1 Tax=Gigaspora rosea TaxID=44941 RepID=A0A397VZG0_9GLOM|nr:hypothetical protein C2G38_2159409 [Gigaspora rosea]